MATIIAAVVGAAGTGYSAYSQSQSSGGKKGGGGGSPIPGADAPSFWNNVFNRGTRDLLDEERIVMEDALSQANFLQPELYKALGYEPIYEDAPAADLNALGSSADAAAQKLAEAQSVLDDAKNLAKRKKDGSPNKKRERAINKARRQVEIAGREHEAAQKALSDAQATPRRITGFRQTQAPDPTNSEDGLFRATLDLQNQTLYRALQGKEPIDSTLKFEFDERERSLRERLRRQLGSDYETSTAGQEALANLGRERAEAFEQYRQTVIKDFSALTESRATALSNLTGARLQQLLFPATQQLSRGQALGQAAQDRLAFTARDQAERQLQQSAGVSGQVSAGSSGAAIGQALGSLANGILAAGGGSSSSSPSTAASDTVQVPSYTSDGAGYSADPLARYLG
jgi:hypothetical protein